MEFGADGSGAGQPPASGRASADHRLRGWVHDDFGVALERVERIADGADAVAEVWRGLDSDGASWAVKWSGGGSPAALVLASRLAQRGAGVVAPRPTRAGCLWSEREGRRLSLTPWVAGSGALSGAMTAAAWASFGALLARVHATPAADAVAAALPFEQLEHAREASAVRAVERRLEMPAGNELVAELAQTWRSAEEDLAALLARAEALSRRLRDRDVRHVVCHGDPHLGNVIVDGEDRAWLLDWDDAISAPRERDLIFAIGGVLAFAPVSPREQAWFFDGYGPVDIDPVRLAYHRCVRALDDLADLAAQVLDRGRCTSERERALALLHGVLSPTGLVRLALL